MKKFIIIVSIWIIALGSLANITAKSELEYEIRYDTNTSETYELKRKIQDIYTELVRGVHKESSMYMVVHNMKQFEYKEGISASWRNNRLLIIEGDGQGYTISGDLTAKSICVPQVEPRSFLKELFE